MELASGSNGSDGVLGLVERLSAEKLLVTSEQHNLRELNQVFKEQLNQVEEQIWISRQEKVILRRLINSDPSVRPENCGQLLASLQSAKFVLAHRVLGHNAANVGSILRICLSNPKSLAELLNGAENVLLKNQCPGSIDDLCLCLFNLIYGASIFPSDEKRVLDLLAHLISIQLVPKSEPRKVLRKGSSAFCKIYSLFSEQLFSAKVFLTAALHEPIMTLLSQEEIFLDIDPCKSPIRLTADERRRRFGTDENSVQFKERVASYRRSVVEKLFKISHLFVKSIQHAVTCFPTSLTWLVKQLRSSLLDKKRVGREEVQLICTDLIFTSFICPAIINPEPHGVISDTPISYVARFNLMQVGQVVQTLALAPLEEPPAYMNHLLQMFSDNPMAAVVKSVLRLEASGLENMADEEGLYQRRNFLGTVAETQLLIEHLRGPSADSIGDENVQRELKQLSRRLPEDLQSASLSSAEGSVNGTPKTQLPRSSSGRLRILADRVQNVAKTQHQKLMTNLPGSNGVSPTESDKEQREVPIEGPEVLVFEVFTDFVPLGMESEEKIMSAAQKSSNSQFSKTDNLTEKKTRFKAAESVVSDHTGTTDAASDDDEDEAENAGSLCSSSVNDNMVDDVDDDPEEDVSTLPDNFSDVVPISANVSGRGSPSLSGGRGSGRGTPFSGGHANAAEQSIFAGSSTAGGDLVQADPAKNMPKLPVTVRKQNPEGLEEKFGKFGLGLPPQDASRYRDETYSLVSDSWSTDVVASDNEGLNDRLETSTSSSAIQPPIPARLHESQSTGQIVDVGGNAPGPSGVLPSLPAPVSLALNDREKMADDILNKYRSPVVPVVPFSASLRPSDTKIDDVLTEPSTPYYDPANPTRCKAFLDAKRKLRLVLSCAGPVSADVVSRFTETDSNMASNNDQDVRLCRLTELLKLLLAEAINSQDRIKSAQVREAQRCLSVFDSKGLKKLLRTLKDEHRSRSYYFNYLQQSRLCLLQHNAKLKGLAQRIQRQKTLVSECLSELLVRYYLERKEKFIRRFVYDFQRMKAQDEKTYSLERALDNLYDQMQSEPMWRYFAEEQMDYTRKAIDRALFAQVYGCAMYPNGEADMYRDEVFFKSLRSIAGSISPDHPELRIPRRFHGECPWPSAQAEIAIINAYKSPRDKLACVVRCCLTIESLLKLASGKNVASADDITPVLVYVLLQANPPALFSNIQFIQGFYSSRIQGEEAYWWTQFHSAVEFLKTLCNKH